MPVSITRTQQRTCLVSPPGPPAEPAWLAGRYFRRLPICKIPEKGCAGVAVSSLARKAAAWLMQRARSRFGNKHRLRVRTILKKRADTWRRYSERSSPSACMFMRDDLLVSPTKGKRHMGLALRRGSRLSMANLARTHLLVVDWGLAPLAAADGRNAEGGIQAEADEPEEPSPPTLPRAGSGCTAEPLASAMRSQAAPCRAASCSREAFSSSSSTAASAWAPPRCADPPPRCAGPPRRRAALPRPESTL